MANGEHAFLPHKFLPMGQRFRGYLPVVVDVESGGFNAQTDALLEIAAIILGLDENGLLQPGESFSMHVVPFEGANLEPDSLAINGIDPWHPLRIAWPEHEALARLFKPIREAIRENACSRAILVGHNSSFDLGFLNAALTRTGIKRNPFHSFSSLDTVSLAAVAYGQTVLSRALRAANIAWDEAESHSAAYDAAKTAELFCAIVNRWRQMEGAALTHM